VELTYEVFACANNKPVNTSCAAGIKERTGLDSVNLYVMGPDDGAATVGQHWTSIPAFPPTTTVNYYLHTGYSLSTSLPTSSSASASFVYNPATPVPTVGGNELFGGCGPQDQRPVEATARADVLTFTSSAFTATTATTGSWKAYIYVSSSANDTDVTVKVTDVHGDGRSLLIIDGIKRMRWVSGYEQQDMKPIVPGAVYLAEVDLEYTSYIWNIGHRLRISISSSNFPRFSNNPNNFASISNENNVNAVVATNTVYFSSAYPSRITLPVVNINHLPESDILNTLAY